MKTPKGTGVATIIVFAVIMFSVAFTLRAQNGPMSSNEFQAMVQALETTTPLPASAAPRFGNFYTTQHGESWPPLPGDTLNLPFWNLGAGWYVLADTNYDWTAAQAQSQSAGGFGMDDGLGSDFQPQLFTTNELWLQITGVTNGTASLVIHPVVGNTNGIYDLEYTSEPDAPWQWLLRTDPGQTNLTVANATNEVGFYRVRNGNDTRGTNFWLGFMNLDQDAYCSQSLYISSPFVATGTVTIPNQFNVSELIVTNGGDTNVNGNYILTDETVDLENFGLGGYTDPTNAYVKGSFLVFYVEGDGWFLCDTSTNVPLYWDFDVLVVPNLLNNVIWFNYSDGSSSPLTTWYPIVTLNVNYSVTPGSLTNVTIPFWQGVMMRDYDVIQTNGINITANAPVSVYAVDYDPEISAAFTCYPTTLLGKSWFFRKVGVWIGV